MLSINPRIVALTPNQTQVVNALKTQDQVHLRVARWSRPLGRFLVTVAHSLKQRYHLNDSFPALYHAFLQEMLVNAQRESDFVFLFHHQILKLPPNQDPLETIDPYEFAIWLSEARREQFMQRVIEFQKRQMEYYEIISKTSKPVLLSDLPPALRETYALIQERKKNPQDHTRLAFMLEQHSLQVTVINKSYLDDQQIKRLTEKILRSSVPHEEKIENHAMDQSHGGHGLGGRLIQDVLFGANGFQLTPEEQPFVVAPNPRNHEVSISLTLDSEILNRFSAGSD